MNQRCSGSIALMFEMIRTAVRFENLVEELIVLRQVLGVSLGFLTLVSGAQAQGLPLPEGTTGLTPLAGQIVDVQQRRVPVAEAVTGSETRIALRFRLNGCLDSLLPLVSHYEVRGQRVRVYVTALNANNEASTRARCREMPQTIAEVSVPGIFQRNQVRVIFLGQPTPASPQGANGDRS